MTKTLKSKVLVVLTVLLLVAMAFVGLMQSNMASAEVASEGYTIGQGAAVRIVDKSSGIRFRANVEESFVNGLLAENAGATLNFYGKINAVGAADSAARIARIASPVFTDDADANESAEITVSVIYNNLADNLKSAAYGVDLYAEFYVEVVVGGKVVDTVEAAGSTDNYSMRSVANQAYLNWTEDVGYEKEALLEYFKVGKTVNTSAGYVSDTAKAEIAFSGVDIAEGSNVKVYIAGKSTTATYKNGEFVVTSAPVSGYVNNKTDYLTYFTADGTAYNVKFTYGKEVNAENMDAICHIYNDIQTASYLVLTQDIDMSGVAWSVHTNANLSRFYGTFDGAGHTIKNLTLNGTNQAGGMFQKLYGKVCNLVMTDVVAASGTSIQGVFANEIYSSASIENVYVNVASMGYRAGALIGLWDSVAPVKNVVVSVDSASHDTYNSALVGYRYNAGMLVDNVHVYSANANLPIFDTTKQPLYSAYTDAENYAEATLGEDYTYTNASATFVGNVLDANLPEFIKNAVVSDYAVVITQENAATAIPAATSGYYVLGEDIDLTGITLGTGTFTGVFNGNGHTVSNFTSTAGYGIWNNVSGATIKNLKVKAILPDRSAVFGRTAGENGATLNNVYVEINSQSTTYTSLFYAVQGNSTFKDVVVNVTSTTGISAVFGGQAVTAGKTMTIDGVVVLGSSNPALTLSSATSQLKAVNGTAATPGVDYIVYTSVAQLASDADGLHVNNPVLKNIIDSELVIPISAKNISKLATATNGYYRLTEDIDFAEAFNGTWTPSSFSGTLDGQGYTISNFSGSSLFANCNGATIKNINFIDATFTGDGFFAPGNGARTATLENSILTFTQFGKDSGSWAALFGGQTSGVLTLNNVYIEIPVTTNDRLGAITKVAETGSKLTNVYLVGGNGGVHSTNSSNNTTFVRTNPTYAPNFIGEAVTYATSEEMLASLEGNLPNFLKEFFFSNGVISAPSYKESDGQFDIWAYSSTNGEWVQYYVDTDGDEIAEQHKFYFVDNGDGTLSLVMDKDLVGNEKIVKLTDLSQVKQYQQAGFTILYVASQVQDHVTASNYSWDSSYAKFFLDIGEQLGMKVMIYQSSIYGLVYDPNTYHHGAVESLIGAGNKFITEEDLEQYIYDILYVKTNIAQHPAFYGISLLDEPPVNCLKPLGEVYRAFKEVCPDKYVMINLLPYTQTNAKVDTDGDELPDKNVHFYNFMGRSTTALEESYSSTSAQYIAMWEAAYMNYLNTYYTEIGQYCGYIQYDNYCLYVEASPMYPITATYLRSHQIVAEFAAEKGLEYKIVHQSRGSGSQRAPSEADMWWQVNVSLAFGAKEHSYYTYYPVGNSGDGAPDYDSPIVDRFGSPNELYNVISDINAELAFMAKALDFFTYKDIAVYTNSAFGFEKTDYLSRLTNGDLSDDITVDINFKSGAAILVAELYDQTNEQVGYYVVNLTSPTQQSSGSVCITIDGYDFAEIWQDSTITYNLSPDKGIEITLGVGMGAFIIPFN